MFNSLVIEAAKKTKVEAGSALAVSREDFSAYITEVIKNHENIEVVYGEITELDLNEYTIIATGPLTSDSFCEYIRKEFGMDDFYFFDAQAPIIKMDSIDMNIAYLKSRYDKGEAAYINCPMSEEEFNNFYNELINARSAELHEFDSDLKVFEGCMPVEVMAKRGRQTLLFGPLKPKGLARDGYPKPYAVVQLRQDDAEKTLYNLVGFQTHLAFPEQKRVFSLIPGLANAEFVKYGRMHKNTYINSPEIINATYQSKKYPKVFFAGQITGVEGYVESSASGIYAAVNMLRLINNEELLVFPKETIMGSMANYISIKNTDFQPINANFGIVPELESTGKTKKKDRKLFYGQRAIDKMREFILECKIKI
jgi:methylenetetrahydrofolate--tRNA-(uracil-5-)-methyltransferase